MIGKINTKRFSLFKLLLRFFILVFFALHTLPTAYAQTPSSDSLLSAFQSYLEPAPTTQIAVNQSELFNAYQNYVSEPAQTTSATASASPAPTPATQPTTPPPPAPKLALVNQTELFNAFKNYVTTTLPSAPLINQGGEVPSPPKVGGVSAGGVSAGGGGSADLSLLTALRNLLNRADIAAQLRGPSGPAGPAGAQGPKGDNASLTAWQRIPDQPNSAPSPGPLYHIPATIIAPNPSANFGGATVFSATNLSSDKFITDTAKTTTLTVEGNSTIAGTLSVTGTATIPTLVTTTGAADSLTIGGGYGSTGVTVSSAGNISANGNLIVDGTSTLTGAVGIAGATTLTNSFSQTGANTFSTGTGAISLNGATAISGI